MTIEIKADVNPEWVSHEINRLNAENARLQQAVADRNDEKLEALESVTRLRAALANIKALVVRDRVPRWQDDYRITITRGTIADICDVALVDEQRAENA